MDRHRGDQMSMWKNAQNNSPATFVEINTQSRFPWEK
jgi:hypothetical protein